MNSDIFVMADRIKKMRRAYRSMAVSVDNLSTLMAGYIEGTVSRKEVIEAVDACRLNQTAAESNLSKMTETFDRLERALYAEGSYICKTR